MLLGKVSDIVCRTISSRTSRTNSLTVTPSFPLPGTSTSILAVLVRFKPIPQARKASIAHVVDVDRGAVVHFTITPHPRRERKAFVRGFLTKLFWTKPLPNPFLSLLGLLLSILSLWAYPYQRLLSPVSPFSVFLVWVVLGFVCFLFVFQACLLQPLS